MPSGIAARDSHSPSSASAAGQELPRRSRACRGVGAAEPIAAPTACRSGCRARPNDVTAITIALRVPILANCCGPATGGSSTAEISSSGSSALFFTPVKKSATGHLPGAAHRLDLDDRVDGEQHRVRVAGR